VLIRLAIAFLAAWAIFFLQVSALDNVPPDYIDKGVHCLHALGHTVTMEPPPLWPIGATTSASRSILDEADAGDAS